VRGKGSIMRKLLVFFIFAFSFGQVNPVRISEKACLSADKALVPIFAKEDLIAIPNQKAEFCNGVNWEGVVIDSVYADGKHYYFNSMALDTSSTPCVVYNSDGGGFNTIMFARSTDSGWHKEIIESGLKYYGFSLASDHSNIVHFSYYRRNDSLDITYHCYGRRDTMGWQIEEVDSTVGYLGDYFWNINSSIDLDTSGLPGIAYTSWNVSDSLHYIKYAHYNGVTWDTSVVEYDSAYANVQTVPTDHSPSLRISSENIPHIAFYHVYALYHADTLKLAHYDENLDNWVVDTVHSEIYAGIPISLALNSQDYACIAHGYDVGLAYTWWDGVSWNTDYGIASIGWIDTRIRLALDSLDRPHILYKHWGTVFPRYCYKDTIWHICGPVEPDTLEFHVDADLDLVFDNNDQPHISYKFVQVDSQFMSGFKYAKGTFVGVEEYESGKIKKELELQIFPNPCPGLLNIEYVLQKPGVAEISIYDVTGARKKSIQHEGQPSGWYQEKVDTKELVSGVYFIVLRQGNDKVSKKFLVIE